MASTDGRSAPVSGIYYREIVQADFQQIKDLHEKLFPVKYSDSFYHDVCNRKGTHNGVLYSKIAVSVSTGKIVGFILAQLFYVHAAEDRDLFAVSFSGPESVLYILTLGLDDNHRRTGLGTELVNLCIDHAKENTKCGAVYLHVIDYNEPAIQFYRKNKFEKLRELPSFYQIKGVEHCAHLYILYINGYESPLMHRLYLRASDFSFNSLIYFSEMMSNLIENTRYLAPSALMTLNIMHPFNFNMSQAGDTLHILGFNNSTTNTNTNTNATNTITTSSNVESEMRDGSGGGLNNVINNNDLKTHHHHHHTHTPHDNHNHIKDEENPNQEKVKKVKGDEIV